MEQSIDAVTNSTIESESLRSRRRKQLIAEFLSISYIHITNYEDNQEINDRIQVYQRRILEIFETIPSNHTQDIQINAIFNEIHRLGLSESLHISIERERESVAREVRDEFRLHSKESVSEDTISERMVDLRQICYDVNSPETIEKIREDFPSGNFLFHGTTVRGMAGIIESGELSNFKKLYEAEQKKAEEEGRRPNLLRRNSGYEGISWSFNAVDALPGTRYHLAGFLTSPESALSKDSQLVIPSRPAPFELLQVSSELESRRYYELKVQDEILGPGNGLSDTSIIANLIFYEMSLGKNTGSVVKEFLSKKTELSELVSLLKSNYSVTEDGGIKFSPELSQQKGEVLPPLLVWMQAIIDTGRITQVEGFQDCTDVYQVFQRISPDNYKSFFLEMKRDSRRIQNELQRYEESISSLEIDLSQMYLVVPDTDVEDYLRLLAINGKRPKGILVYESSKVSIENFASKSKGDHEEFTALLRNVVPQGDGAIDYEDQILGLRITPDIRVGHAGHVLKDSALTNKRIVVMAENGNLVVK